VSRLRFFYPDAELPPTHIIITFWQGLIDGRIADGSQLSNYVHI